MVSKIPASGRFGLIISVALMLAPADARAQDAWELLRPAAPVDETLPMPPSDVPEPDWTLLDSSMLPTGKLASRNGKVQAGSDAGPSWTSHDKPDGSTALTVKQPLLPFWDTRVGADINVAQPGATLTTQDSLRQKFGADAPLSQSSGAAWAAMTAPGVGTIWDQTAIEARVDPLQDQGKFGTSLSKSVPLGGNQYSLTLQNGVNVIQQGAAPTIGYNGRPTRSYETDQSAKLSIADTGTSLVAGQTLSTTDDKWLRKVGAEQKLFGGVNVTATVSETLQGPANKSLTAGFKHSW